eukprot:TRINITY_DN1471_c1_g3_i1.p1 TRINITY_DN1471_c1_g3~~TRINITY_DN1471_c1_g3_i1.p1  ORF type:complete len:749 (+),score=150.30 TRINITY_DN1471_c1_g3_i1:82-2328(+)
MDRGGISRFRVVKRLYDGLRVDGDTESEVGSKVAWWLNNVVCICMQCVMSYTFPIIAGLVIVFDIVMLAWLWHTKDAGTFYLIMQMASWCGGIAWYDSLLIGYGQRAWPCFVILCDLLLFVEAPRVYTQVALSFVVFWLVVVEVEQHTRWMGLFDLPESASFDTRRAVADCDQPPCSEGYTHRHTLNMLGMSMFVFFLDYAMTRWFAGEMIKEKNCMAAAVRVSKDVLHHLARFDLEAAEASLEVSGSELPPDLYEYLHHLHANLESYKPYLPDELFASTELEQPAEAQVSHVPGLHGHARVSLAFTDIRSSTALWESSGAVMGEALETHNAAIRAAVRAFNGYEVKTIGDAFMVAFFSSGDAVGFGGAAQTALGVDTRWPEGLTRPNMDDGLPVLAVRMGIHSGEATVQRNGLTQRYDYFGPTVNRAARVEPFGAPGAVTVTAEVMDDADKDKAILAEFVVIPYRKPRTGKGLAAPLMLTALLPRRVHGIEAGVRAVALGAQHGRVTFRPPHLTSPPQTTISEASSVASTCSSSAVLHRSRRPDVFSGIHAASACVAAVNFAPCGGVEEAWSAAHATRRLQALQSSAAATRGQLSAVVGQVAWVSWGLFGACKACVQESGTCMAMFSLTLAAQQHSKDPDADASSHPLFHAGIAAGPVSSVELALSDRGRRFVTLFGASVWTSGALCRRAEETGECVLVGASAAALEKHLRPASGAPVLPAARALDLQSLQAARTEPARAWVDSGLD